jgi:hypothetical protein
MNAKTNAKATARKARNDVAAATAIADNATPTRGTHRTHAHAADGVYYGSGPVANADGVAAYITIDGGLIHIWDAATDTTIERFGVATKFWLALTPAAPVKAAKAATGNPATAGVRKAELSARAAKAAATRAEAVASGEIWTCVTCDTDKAITSFPTTTRDADGNMRRGTTCRACRDAR